ncbi:hypothetical protein [Flavobacterium sp.]|uniref:hypothetical protein n=1 Tax=Flavobacterium sp. TaxID=239 RepID=UPI0025F2AD38|nr:hypothetical protein [Flavobacterium sp.]
MKKYHFILLLLLGIFFMPNNSYACGTCSDKHPVKKEISSKTDKDKCCDSDHSKSKNHDGCGGKCGHSKCGCPSVSNGFTVSSELVLKNNIFDFSFEKQKFSNTETFISSGFYSLWLIPKIS